MTASTTTSSRLAAHAAPTGSRRFWLTVIAFALANVITWVGYHQFQESRKNGVLRVERFSHAGTSEVTEARPTLAWSFNLDIAPTATVAGGTITPAIPGKWAWRDPRTLTFQPDGSLPKATRFTVTLPANGSLRTAQGFRLRDSFVSTFQTPALSVQRVRQIGFDEERAVLELTFDDAVLPADVTRHLSITGPDGKALTFEPHGETDGNIVRIRTSALPPAPPTGSGERSVRVALSPGLAGRSGPVGMKEPFVTSVVVDEQLIATEASAYPSGRGESQIRLGFNNAAPLDRIKQVLSIEPAIPFSTTSSYDGGIQLSGDFTAGTRYAIKLAAPPAGMDRSKFPRPTTLSVFIPDHEPAAWFEHQSGYLGSRGNRTLLAHAVNAFDLTVRVTRLYDNNLVEWRNASARDRDRGSGPSDAYATPIAAHRITLAHKKNQKQDVRVALDEILPKDAARDGAYRIELVPNPSSADGERPYTYSRYGGASGDAAVVTLSDIGLSAKCGRDSATAWVVSLSTAQPLPGVRVRVFSSKNQPLGDAVSNADGLVTIPIAKLPSGEDPAVVIADRGTPAGKASDVTWLDLRDSSVRVADADTTGRPYLRDGHEAFVYTDRGVYRPGETVHLRAIVRGPNHATPVSFPVTFQIVRPDLRNWRAQTTSLDADGAAGFDLALPSDLTTGKWTANIGLPGGQSFGAVTFQVEEFIPDRMKVALTIGDAKSKSERVSLGDAPLRASVQADYLFGRPVAARPAKLVTRVDPATFRPKGWDEWTFGDTADVGSTLGTRKPLGRRGELPDSDLSEDGHAAWEIDVRELIAKGGAVDTKKPEPDGNAAYPGPWTLTTTASVTEEGGRAVSATSRIDVDLVPYYIAVRRPSELIRPKSEQAFSIAFVDTMGKPAKASGADQLSATLYREDWNNSLVHDANGRYRYETTRVLEAVDGNGAARIGISADGRGATCSVTAPISGSYVLAVRDAKTRCVTSVSFYAGDSSWDEQISREDPEKAEIVILPPGGPEAFADALRRRDFGELGHLIGSALTPAPSGANARAFRVGERPRVLVRSPFKGRLLLSVETDGVVSTRVIDMPASQVTIPIAVTDACRPNAYVRATIVRAIDPDAKWRAHRATGVTRLCIDNSNERLNVQIAAPTEIRPSTTLSTQLRVTDSLRKPVANAAVTVAAVDEGICRLTDFKTPDPFTFFTATRALGVETADLYGQLMPEVPRPDKSSTPGGDDSDDAIDAGRHRSPVSAKRVRPVALFTGVLHTDADGVARGDFTVPQFTGQLRLMAVAYAGKPGFGSADKDVIVRSPLLVQSSWPRFAAPGDRFTVPIVIFNNTPGLASDVNLRLDLAADTIRFADGDPVRAARTIRVDGGGQAVASVDVVAFDRIGIAKVRLVAKQGDESFEESVELPIRPISPRITRGGYLATASGKPDTLTLPRGMLEGTERAQINVTPWPTLQLPDGLEYLDRYPYGCAEQTISTTFPLVYLNDIGDAIAPQMFDRARVAEKVQAGVIRLLGMRTADGGVGMWQGARQAWPWASVYAAHFAVEARAAGHAIPDDLYDGLLGYARSTLAHSGDEADTLETQAYACYVLALAGKPERAAMSRLGEVLNGPAGKEAVDTDDEGASPTHARFHLAAAWLAAGRRDLASSLIPNVLPTPRAARQQSGNVGSPVRDRALVLATLVAIDPERPDLPALAQSLADAGRDGHWCSTQDTAFAVMALGRYVKQMKTAAPYESVELWADGRRVASAKAGESLAWDVATALLNASKPFEVRVAGPAGAKAHVSWLQTGVPLQPPANSDNGMKVRRRYLDERDQSLRDNAVRSGDLVKVELTLESTTSLDNIVIEDLLPACLEIENPRLATTAGEAKAADKANAPPTFAERRLDMRDDRLILVGDLVRPGVATYVYTARAVAPGTFAVPPVRAECMYDIATSSIAGSGGTIRVIPAGASGLAGTIGD